MMNYKSDHPERKEDEVFLGNFEPVAYAALGFKTKRCGIFAYTINGEPYPYQKEYKVYPVFVKKSEIPS